MRFLITAIVVELLLSTFWPGSTFSLIWGVALTVLVFFLLKREALVLAPLLLAVPFVAAMWQASGAHFIGVMLLGALLFLAVSDIESRQKGAPLRLTRLLFWYLSGSTALLLAFYTAVTDQIVPVWFLLLFSTALGAGGIVLARDVVERSRGAKPPAFPAIIDAFVIGFLATEGVIVLAFLPFSPIALAALATVLLWLLVRTTVAHRFGTLTMSQLVRFSMSGLVMVTLITASALLT